ncbi:VOC family protein [Pseudorhodobacter turbinis]|uniref:VOC family protein n=1 Tax=Pseudorhodobacter turbinis TaxID=2500533 RepID=A0A4P8ECN1_9RHOB|nr:VOC family protein [Pseudorhodobacter turbinis]QCO54467.1 VOC family protein [Pseudorhodobacter turbinis]
MLILDHLALSATTLAEGVEAVETALGVSLATGGEHPLMSTHNRLLGLGDVYLEVIAINPDAPRPPHPRWFDLDHFSGRPRLTNWVLACDDLDTALAHLPQGVGAPTDLARGDLRWRMAIPPDGRLPFAGAHPAVIEWQGPHPAQRLPDSGIRLTQFEVITPDAAALQGLQNDPRVTIIQGATLAMRATFSTPHGPRILE